MATAVEKLTGYDAPQRLMREVYRYAERLYLLSHLVSAAALVAVALVTLHVGHMLTRPSASSVVVILLLSAVIVFLTRQWRVLHERACMFRLDVGPRGRVWSVARRRARDPFHCVPARFISHAEAPAPAGICADLRQLGARCAEVAGQLDRCLQAHGRLTNHDAANLLLVAISRLGE